MTASASPQVHWWWTDLGQAEIEGVIAAIRDRCINQGRLCRELEARLAAQLEVPHVVVTSSGSLGLVLALLACDVGPGDEVIVPAATFIAPAHAALLLGARVRLADVRGDRPILDADQLEAAITSRTKVVIPVHLNGRACDLEAIHAVADRRGIAVVEDASQAFCSRGSGGWLGTRSRSGVFSMGLTKLITTGEGGFVVTRDAGVYARLVALRNHGTTSLSDNRFDGFGNNFRLTDLQAAVGLAQMRRVSERMAGVRRVYEFYRHHLRGLSYLRPIAVQVDEGELPLWTEVLCAERATVARRLRGQGIETRAYHPPLNASPHLGVSGAFPNAERFAALGLTLPSGPDQPEAHLQRTVEALRALAPEIAPLGGGWPAESR
jgi:dTDP-4-amino-4,6-dideoxygalactose transaminase